MLRITSLDVTNVGPFSTAHFEFPEKVLPDKAEIHVFTGVNGSGKSTVLMMLASFQSFINFSGLNSLLVTRLRGNDSEYRVSFGDGSVINYKKYQPVINSGDVLGVFQRNREKQSHYATYNYCQFAYSGSRQIRNIEVSSITEIKEEPLDEYLDFDKTDSANIFLKWIASQKTRTALALEEKNESAASEYTNSVSRIEDALSEITNDNIKFRLNHNPFRIEIEKNGLRMDVDALPDGLKSILSWLGDLLMRLDRLKWQGDIPVLDRNFALFLDEIDVHLHPEWQRKILPVVQSLFKNAQIFITTHSPFVINSCDGVWIHNLELRGNESVPQNPVMSENSKSYELVLQEVFGIKQHFGLEVEEKLSAFRPLLNKAQKTDLNAAEEQEFLKLIQSFANEKGLELQNIIGVELKQLKRLTGKDYLSKYAAL